MDAVATNAERWILDDFVSLASRASKFHKLTGVSLVIRDELRHNAHRLCGVKGEGAARPVEVLSPNGKAEHSNRSCHRRHRSGAYCAFPRQAQSRVFRGTVNYYFQDNCSGKLPVLSWTMRATCR